MMTPNIKDADDPSCCVGLQNSNVMSNLLDDLPEKNLTTIRVHKYKGEAHYHADRQHIYLKADVIADALSR